MIILASDTCTKSISAALFEDGKILSSYTGDKGMTHSQTHMPLIQEILKNAGKNINQVDLFACTTGPGSYTGIRIGVTTTKTLAYATGKDAIGISALEVLAYPHKSEGCIVCPLLDARNRRVFAGGFINGELIIPEENYSIIKFFEKIHEYIISSGSKIRDVVICGDAAKIYDRDPEILILFNEYIRETKRINLTFIKTMPDAEDLAKIAYEKYSNEIVSPCSNKFSPFLLNAKYLSPSSAERMKKECKKCQ
jgi:tRNA threonylcarbamoyladenosine biosynthesis protein TsaB